MITKIRPRDNLSRSARDNYIEGLHIWVAFWRNNIHRFALDFLELKLKPFQILLLYLMHKHNFVMLVASRGLGKSFLIAIYCCCVAILYPGKRIIIGAGSRGQAKLLISEKIDKELRGMSPNLRKEIKEVKVGANDVSVIFWNGSSIVAVVSGDGARGHRGHLFVGEEFRLIEKDVLDKIFRPMLAAPRMPGYTEKEEYKNYPAEQNSEIYISSAWYKSHHSYDKFKAFTKKMLNGDNTFVCDLPYTVAVENGLLTKERVAAIKSEDDMNEISWLMEMEGVWYGENDDAFFKSADVNPCRTLRKPFYPPTNIEYALNKGKKKKASIPKQENEIRIIGVDIAVAAGKQNDNSVFTLLRVLPNGGEYQRQMVYMETYNGMNPEKQALRIKQLMVDFEADYLVIDRSSVGLSVWSELQKVTHDVERDVEYPAYTSINDDNTVDKFASRGSLAIVYTIANPSPEMNSRFATELLSAFLKKKLRLLINDTEAKNEMNSNSDFVKKSPEEQAYLLKPYVQTTAMINELINLQYTVKSNNIVISEKGSARKDRYSSISYANYYADIIEKKLTRDLMDDDEVICIWN